MQSFSDFRSTHLGFKADYDGSYGGECVDLYNFYMRDVLGLNPWRFGAVEYAYQLADNLKQYPEIEWVDNDPNDPNQVPPLGAIVIFSDAFAIKGGHVGIVDQGTSNASLLLFDQVGNPIESLERPPATRRYNWNNVLGWAILRKIMPADPGGGIEVIGNREEAIRQYKLLRPGYVVSEPEVAGVIGMAYRNFAVGAEKEIQLRDEALHQKDVYINAMQSDLTTLRSQAVELGERPTKAKLEELTTNIEVLKSGTVKHVEMISGLEAQIKAMESEVTEPEKFVRRILQSIAHLVPINKVNAFFKKLKP